MPLFSSLLVGLGALCLLTGWLFSRKARPKGESMHMVRGIISRIEDTGTSCLLTVSFTPPSGQVFHYRTEAKRSSAWYEGMPLLVQFTYHRKETRVIQVQTYWQAYALAFSLLLAGVLLVVAGSLLF